MGLFLYNSFSLIIYPALSKFGSFLAAYLAGLKSGVYESIEQLKQLNQAKTEEILPNQENELVRKGYEGWKEKLKEN